MLNEFLKAKIESWINEELSGYKLECGAEYRQYLIEDGLYKFVSDRNLSLSEDVREFICKILNGE